MFAVMLMCRTGTKQFVNGAWESAYHTITWCYEPTEAAAWEEALRCKAASPREVLRAGVMPYAEARARWCPTNPEPG